jgi:hypothetical protein
MKVSRIAIALGVTGIALGGLGAAPAMAQATRTWVSGVGDDANPCSRTAPCKTFAGAISKTATGGEINCLDPGGFGGVTITKSLTIRCDYTEGGVLVSGAGVNGIIVNAAATSEVFLSGLDIFGASTAQNGVRIIAGATVTIENSVIHGFNATNGLGISFQPSGATNLFLNNVTVRNNGTAGTGGGILIQPTGAGGNARVTMRDTRVRGNSNINLNINTTGNTGTGIEVSIDTSDFTGSGTGINLLTPGGTATARFMLTNSTIANNTSFGINANGPTATGRVSNTTITNSGTAVNITNSAVVNTFGDNHVVGNSVNGFFTLPALTPQ